MRERHFVLGTAGVVVLSAMALSAQAAPLGGAANDLKASVSNPSGVEQTAFRRCWWRHGVRVCRWVGEPYDDGDYYDGGTPYYYGYGPGISLYFGGGWGGGWHGGHHYHHR
jgi:hypothetical protein